MQDENEKDKTLKIPLDEFSKRQSFFSSSRFNNLKFLGEGGSGRVYKAYDNVLKEYVAIKLIPKDGLDEQGKERLLREVRVARNLSHKNLLKYYDINEDKDYLIIIMEYIDGETLERKLRREGKLKEEEIKDILLKLTDIIDFLHKNGIIHRDIKPANIFITKNGEMKLGDFGIIHLKEEYERLTKTNQTIGTPTYMSPEQLTGEELTEKSDYYSLGITLYEMLTGDVPFSGTIGEIIKNHLSQEVPSIEGSKKFNKLLRGLTLKDSKSRWGYEEIQRYLEDKKLPLLPKQKNLINLSIFSILLIVFIYFFLIPKILLQSPISLEFKGNKLKVYGKSKLLFEKEMDKEISEAKIIGKDEIAIGYYIKPENFSKDNTKKIKIAEILNKKGSIKENLSAKEMHFSYFQKFSLNYSTNFMPYKIIKNNGTEKKGYLANTIHRFYPCIISFLNDKETDSFIISNPGHIEYLIEWEDKLILIGFNNLALHQIFLAVSKKEKDIFLSFEQESTVAPIISYYFLGFCHSDLLTKHKIENGKLKISVLGEDLILEPNGQLLGQKEGTRDITVKFISDYAKIKTYLENRNLEKAEELIKESIKISEIFELYGWTVVFAEFLSDLEFLKGNVQLSTKICLDYGKKYEKYGIELNTKAALLNYLSGNYERAIKLWEENALVKGFRTAEVNLYPTFALILNEDWEGANYYLASEDFSKEGIWYRYKVYQKGLMMLLRKDIKGAVKIFKESLNDIEQEDNAALYFLSKICEGKPDPENYEKFIKNYITGPLHLQFAGACTKGDWEKAKIFYYGMEKISPMDNGIAIYFSIIKKIIKTYPEKFSKLKIQI